MLKKWYSPDDASYFLEEVDRDIDAVDKNIPVWKEVECETKENSCPKRGGIS